MASTAAVGEAGGGFPATRYSVVQAAGSADPEVRRRAFGALVASYWKPAYKYLRVRWGADHEDASDLTQEFFARAFEKQYFDRYDPRLARFRTFLRTCLDRFAANRRRAQRRVKRGGDSPPLSLDFAAAEGELAAAGMPAAVDPEEYFHREWMRSFFELVVEELRQRCREQGRERAFSLFERYDLEGAEPGRRLTYAQLAAEAGIPVTQVTNHLAWVRRELRRTALKRLAELCGNDEEFRSEARLLLGVDPGG
jgi:RNA polymerase sigma factor (sigma-70 family)